MILHLLFIVTIVLLYIYACSSEKDEWVAYWEETAWFKGQVFQTHIFEIELVYSDWDNRLKCKCCKKLGLWHWKRMRIFLENVQME